MPSTCGVTWLLVILSASGRSPEVSVGLDVGCSIEHLVADPQGCGSEHPARAWSVEPTAAHVLLVPCEGFKTAHVQLAVRVRTWAEFRMWRWGDPIILTRNMRP